MKPMEEEGTDHESQVARALAEYLAHIAEGRPQDRAAFLARYPGLASDLAGELDTVDQLAEIISDSKETPFQIGDFRIVRLVARGGMGLGYEAGQQPLDRRVALKVLSSVLVPDPTAVARFQREPRLAAALEHPNIVRIYAAGF